MKLDLARRVPPALLPFLALLLVGQLAARPAHSQPTEPGATQARLLGPPPSLAPVSQPLPLLEAREYARRAWLVSANSGFVQQLCPSWVEQCSSGLGWSLGVSLLSRPTSWFAWGPVLSAARAPERYQNPHFEYVGTIDEAAALLAGRASASGAGRAEPYVQLASGVARAERQGGFSGVSPDGALSETRLVPIYSVHAGLDLHLTEHWRMGLSVGLTHRLSGWQRRCIEAGVCLGADTTHFSLEHGTWGMALSFSGAFGERL